MSIENEENTKGDGIYIHELDLTMSQLNLISGQFKLLAKEINKSQDECIKFVNDSGPNLKLINFTSQFLIGCALIQLNILKDNLHNAKNYEILDIIFFLGQILGIAQALKNKGVVKNSFFRIFKSERAKFAAIKRHERTADAKSIITEIWKSGKYKSRDICAEQECAALNISFSTARKALRNAPKAA